MITRVQKDGKTVFLPLVFDPDHDEWIPVSETTYATPMEAAQALYTFHLDHLKTFILSARKLRALTEHPGFQELDADGISADVIYDEARRLTELIERKTLDLCHLLDEPTRTDKVRLSRHLDSTPPRQRTPHVVQTKPSRKDKVPKHLQDPGTGAAVLGSGDVPSKPPAPPGDGNVHNAGGGQAATPRTGGRAQGKRRSKRERDAADPWGLRKVVRERIGGRGSGNNDPGSSKT